MVKFGLGNLDAAQELVKIHGLETEEEVKVFGDFETFFEGTREELVEGVMEYLLEDTIKVLNDEEGSSS